MSFDLAKFRRMVLTDPLVHDAWDQKYRWKNPDGSSTENTVDDTRERVVRAVHAQDDSQEALTESLDMVIGGYFVPAGRVNAGAGMDRSVTLMNCLSGREKLFTKDQGLVALADCAGQQVSVLTRDGWEPAVVRSFGKQRLNLVTMCPVYPHVGSWKKSGRSLYQTTVEATANHRWILVDGTETTQLAISDKIQPNTAKPPVSTVAYNRGFRHGVVFGDGSLNAERVRTGFDLYQVRLCGERKRTLVSAFEDIEFTSNGKDTDQERCNINRDYFDNGDIIVTHYSDVRLKELPITGLDSDYYAGFVAGWLATDGYYHPNGDLYGLGSTDEQAMDWFEEHSPLAGFVTVGRTSQYRPHTNFSSKPSTIYSARITESHKMAWRVTDIQSVAEETVYCAVVPGAKAFTLAKGIYTGNCFVNHTVQDSMPGIQRVIMDAALTMQQGGGIGTDWSTVRPAGALVARTGSVSSGVIPFMDQMSAMCKTIVSAGTRRGAMMGTLRDDHPDLWNPDQFETVREFDGTEILRAPSFISAKRQKGRLNQFNVSVLVSEEFMDAVAKDADWDLGFHVPRADDIHVDMYMKPMPYDEINYNNDMEATPGRKKGTPVPWYVYRRVKARTIWNDIMQSTYVYAEPGVIFIDRVNNTNNLKNLEDIRCTNPCGEQPLPPHGICCLGSVNLAFMVEHPFSDKATINYPLLRRAIAAGVRFLDNVLTVTKFPLISQKEESDSKRRIGLGVTGFGDMLVQLGITYGSYESVKLSKQLSRELQATSYTKSAELARERGAFPLFNANLLERPYLMQLETSVRHIIRNNGLRNGVLNTVAPNGTISLYTGNVSSGIEPIFSTQKFLRKVRQPDGSFIEYEAVDYAQRLYEAMFPGKDLPSYFVGASDVHPADHIRVQAAWQAHIDAAISKTVNCSVDLSFEDFESLYMQAYETGCKGCTTYRPDPAAGRGSILTEIEKPKTAEFVVKVDVADMQNVIEDTLQNYRALRPRPDVVPGNTHKLKWPLTGDNAYITITNAGGDPLEVFIKHNDPLIAEWTDALSRMITGVLRRGGDVKFIVDQLRQVGSAKGGAFVDSQFYPSVVAAIGGKIEAEFKALGVYGKSSADNPPDIAPPPSADVSGGKTAAFVAIPGAIHCPVCGSMAFVHENGCKKCLECGHEACG